MDANKPLAIIDPDTRRRAAIAHSLSKLGLYAFPLDTVAELTSVTGLSAILANDEDGLVQSSLDCLDELNEWTPVIAYGSSPDPDAVVDAVFRGVQGYLRYPFDDAQLSESLAKVLARANAIRAQRESAVHAKSRMERLSRREREVVSGLSEGLTNKGIAQRLDISPRTVEVHRNNAQSKMGAANSTEVVRIALSAGGLLS